MDQIEIDMILEIPVPDYSGWSPELGIIDANITSYHDFFHNYMIKNLPCVIKNVSETWDCTQKWVKNGDINYEYLIKTYGMLEAPVANCNDINFNSQCKTDMKVEEFMGYMQNKLRHNLLYLKDWHLKRLLPNDNFYIVPKMFASDWLNEYCLDNEEDDFMFVYIGPSGSWTPLHADVYCSYSWSVNIIGKKKWTFFPPGEEKKLKDKLGNLPIMFQPEKYKDVKYFEIIQEKGDVLFVPSGWHHQVVNEKDTISVNHNWINGCNIILIWNALTKSLKLVEEEIIEFKDTPEYFSQCQIILKCYFGMDFDMFLKFIRYIGKKRKIQISNYEENLSNMFGTYCLGKNHLKFDIIQLIRVMETILKDPYVIEKKYVLGDDFFEVQADLLSVIT